MPIKKSVLSHGCCTGLFSLSCLVFSFSILCCCFSILCLCLSLASSLSVLLSVFTYADVGMNAKTRVFALLYYYISFQMGLSVA